jgi:hypothetical protein
LFFKGALAFALTISAADRVGGAVPTEDSLLFEMIVLGIVSLLGFELVFGCWLGRGGKCVGFSSITKQKG